MGKFTVQQFRSGYRFSLKAGNGQIIAASPIYCTKEACLAGVRAVQRLASSPVEDLSSPRTAEPGTGPRYQIYEDKGSVCFRLLDEQGAHHKARPAPHNTPSASLRWSSQSAF